MPPALDPDHMPLCLVTLAGTEHTMPVNLAQYENLAQLEEDILSFLPTVSDIDVFGCQVDLVELEDQLPLDDAFQAVLLQHKRIQVIIRSCLEVCHSIWQTQESNIPSCPKAVHVPCNPRGAQQEEEASHHRCPHNDPICPVIVPILLKVPLHPTKHVGEHWVFAIGVWLPPLEAIERCPDPGAMQRRVLMACDKVSHLDSEEALLDRPLRSLHHAGEVGHEAQQFIFVLLACLLPFPDQVDVLLLEPPPQAPLFPANLIAGPCTWKTEPSTLHQCFVM